LFCLGAASTIGAGKGVGILIQRRGFPVDLPAQAPTKYTFVVNISTARKLGPLLPLALLARADAAIE
jgi:hypothetical protein